MLYTVCCLKQTLLMLMILRHVCLSVPPAYLCNVLAALGQSPIKQLTQLESLIKATRDE